MSKIIFIAIFSVIELLVFASDLTKPPGSAAGPIIGSDTVCFNLIPPQIIPPEVYSVPDLGDGWSYQWQSAGNIISAQGNDSIYIDWTNIPAGPGGFIPNAVSVIATDPNGIESAPAYFDLTIFYVNPTITPIGPFCLMDECVFLQATPTGGVFNGDGVNGNQFCPQQANNVLQSPFGNYVTYTYSQSGCTFSTGVNVLVYEQPGISNILVLNLTQSYLPNGETIEVCEGDSINRVYGISALDQGINEWTVLGNTIQSPDLNMYWTPLNQPGVYQISVVRYNGISLIHGGDGCPSDPRYTTVTIECSVDVDELTRDIEVWPNPFNSIINIQAPSNSGVVRIYSVCGNLVYQSKYTKSNLNIESDFLPKGTYFITLTEDNGMFLKKKIVK